MANLNVAVGEAVSDAKEAYKNAEKSPIGQGFAHIEGVDGRTSLAAAMNDHPDVEVTDWDYITVSGVSQYLAAQKSAYRTFISTLEDYGVDTDGIYVRGHLD